MISEQCAELVRSQFGAGQDLAHGASRDVVARVDRHDNHASAVGMAHEVMATLDANDSEAGLFQRPNDPCSWCRRDGAGHKPARYYKSGHVERQSHLVRRSDLFDQKFQSLTQVGNRSFLCRPVAERGDARTKLRGAAPDAVLVLLHYVGHMNDTSHTSIIARGPLRFSVVPCGFRWFPAVRLGHSAIRRIRMGTYRDVLSYRC